MLADATMQGVLDVCEELVLLTQAVRSRARSRLAGPGILLVNGKVSPIPIGGDVADANPDEDPFVRDLDRGDDVSRSPTRAPPPPSSRSSSASIWTTSTRR
jgi:hypothetical protein